MCITEGGEFGVLSAVLDGGCEEKQEEQDRRKQPVWCEVRDNLG